jgi:hypothetical protein
MQPVIREDDHDQAHTGHCRRAFTHLSPRPFIPGRRGNSGDLVARPGQAAGHQRGATDKRPLSQSSRPLRAEIDKAAWSALYSTKSHPFDPPKTGKIAVKVFNHYEDEVLKVYQV